MERAADDARELPRFLYQPPIAAPILGPRLIPHSSRASCAPPGVTARPTTAAAEPIYADAYRDSDAGALLPPVPRARAHARTDAAGWRSRRGCCRAARTRSAPRWPPASNATATTPARSCSTAAGTSSPRSARTGAHASGGVLSHTGAMVVKNQRDRSHRGSRIRTRGALRGARQRGREAARLHRLRAAAAGRGRDALFRLHPLGDRGGSSRSGSRAASFTRGHAQAGADREGHRAHSSGADGVRGGGA